MKKSILFFLSVLLLIECKHARIKEIKTQTQASKRTVSFKSDTVNINSEMKVINYKDHLDTLIKFNLRINNRLYYIKPEKLVLKQKLDFSKYEFKKMFRTKTKEGVNFAGHYCFVSWGCGSPCQLSAVIDMKSGIVYNGISAGNDYQFEKDSKLLIVNPPDSAGWYYKDALWQEPSLFVWSNNKFTSVQNSK